MRWLVKIEFPWLTLTVYVRARCPYIYDVTTGRTSALRDFRENFNSSLLSAHSPTPRATWNRWRSRHHFEGSRSSTNWAGYKSTSKQVQGCTQQTHSRVMGSSKFVEAHWAWSTWATTNHHLDSSSKRIRSMLRIGKKYFRIILEG